MSEQRRVGLIILDGWGYREETADNAVAQGRTPTFDQLWSSVPHTLLRTDGHFVGLPDGQFGNSEVGHMNLGAGRVVMQDLPRIDRALEGDVAATMGENEAFSGFVAALKSTGGRCHLMGLLSRGGVHAHQRHMARLVQALTAHGVGVVLHLFTDGRDTPPRSAARYFKTFLGDIEACDGVTVGSVSGRYFAMDRDRRWDRVERAFNAIVEGEGLAADDPVGAVEAAYGRGETDEFIQPTVIDGFNGIESADGIFCANFRTDRAREILSALTLAAFDCFDRGAYDTERPAVGMVEYGGGLEDRIPALFAQESLAMILGEVIANAGLQQVRLAETEKYPHVTFFFNGGRDEPFEGEKRVLVPSPKVATYDLQPEMSAPEVGRHLVEAIRDPSISFILCNFANPDMVGHTGSLKAAIKAVETVDACLADAVAAAEAAGVTLLVTADHGNCDVMRDPETGEPHTAHTLNPVPCLLVNGPPGLTLHPGVLADMAPSVVELLGLAQPAAMTGRSLLQS